MTNAFREQRCDDFLGYLKRKEIQPDSKTAMNLAIVWNGNDS